MKYAIISDIHGNLDALNAVLDDAIARNVQKYIFAGDYVLGFPYVNQILEKIKSINNSIVIAGNGDKYYKPLEGKASSQMQDGQYQAVYWTFGVMTDETKNYLYNLPDKVELVDEGIHIHIAHSSVDFFGFGEIDGVFKSSAIRRKYSSSEDCRRCISSDILWCIEKDADYLKAIEKSEDGIYIFGHTHSQWDVKLGGKYLINGGACGIPMDRAEADAPYTILNISNGSVAVTPIRVKYDTSKAIDTLKNSTLYTQALPFSMLNIKVLTDGIDCLSDFVRFAKCYADSSGDMVRPISKDTWNRAFAEYREKIKNE